MAMRTMQVLKDMKYGTRMLRAGDTVDLKGPDVRLYTALGAVGPMNEGKIRRGGLVPDNGPLAERPIPAPSKATAEKAAPRKRATKKRATAKK